MNEGMPAVDEFEAPLGEVNISAAIEVLQRAEGGNASLVEINETIGVLQELQNDGVNDSAIAATLARLIAARPL